MKRRTFIQLGLIAVPVAGGIIACDNTPKTQPKPTQSAAGFDQLIKIGSVLTLTGAGAQVGQEILAGQKLAVEYWKTKGIQVQLFSDDSKNTPKDGLSAFKALKARGLNFFVANSSGVSLALKPEINDTQDTLLALAAHPAITSPLKSSVFRYSNTAADEAKTLVEWIEKASVKNTVIIFHSADEYGIAFNNSLQASLKKLGIPNAAKAYRKEDIPEMRSLVQSALPQSTYLPVVVGSGQPMTQVITVLRTLGCDSEILTNIGFALTGVKQQLGSQAGKIVYVELDLPANPDLAEGAKQYFKSFNKEITPDAQIGFNTISLLAKVCQKFKTIESSKINIELLKTATSYFSPNSEFSNNEIVVKVKLYEA